MFLTEPAKPAVDGEIRIPLDALRHSKPSSKTAQRFIEATAHLSGECIISITKERVTVLTDDKGMYLTES